jgi:dienelactone hydrolase
MLRAIPSLLLFVSLSSQGAVVGREVSYRAGDTPLKGYLAYDDAIQGTRPGILVVHEWWGQNAYARKRADMLAELGYTALALDMYGEGRTAGHPDDAARFSGAVRQNLPLMKARFLAARTFLTEQPSVDPDKIAAIGYCFGGSVVLEMAIEGVDLAAAASFHGGLGGLSTPAPGAVKAKLLVANGADDPFATAEQIAAFKAMMTSAGADYTFINYPGARHAFTNPEADQLGKRFNLPLAYNAKADHASWQALQQLLGTVFTK